jgi:hypothetical protein
MGHRAGLDTVAKRKRIPRPYEESKPDRPARSLIITLTELPHVTAQNVYLAFSFKTVTNESRG